MNNLDTYIFNFLNGAAGYHPSLDMFFIFLTSYLAYSVSILVGLYVLFVVPYRHNTTKERMRALRQGIEFLFATATTWAAVSIVKTIVARPRPFSTLQDIAALLPNESGYSFPSGHAALTFAVATTVFLHHKRLGIYLYAFAFIVAISRVFVGVHYPIDILVGAILGIIVSTTAHILVPKRLKIEK